ncbi:unnamed protein product [Chondrus crispus]|uniref:Plastid lipid-associated protein/fibrillin conserved domain-containing protein n=1 Tax=Chondrus crispus TaxID=2769 RepID=R7Q8K7_CHOCR|nr:unnamed protein product [Chondrus crispus]CDF34128.1 unnamed protein product [Chondrus crispus]|eukprot:XP_005713947.1 unnamed protein product [Chondrus crispus]
MLCARLFYDFPQPKFWMLSGNLMYSNRRRFASRCLVENHSGKAPRSQRVCSPTRARRVYHSVGIKACAAGPQELRKQLLDLVDSFGRLGGKNQSAVDDIEDALSALLSSRGSDSSSSLLANDLDPSLTAGWEERLEGRWNLRYSTEGPLLQLMTNQALPFLSTGQVYQLFRGDGTLQQDCAGRSERRRRLCR